jgi:hypothetical protein
MKYLIWGLILLLAVLHQDNWFWDDTTLVFGFMPIGLFYHACISAIAGLLWFLATKYCWPPGLDRAPRAATDSSEGVGQGGAE